ncbi:MAG TPA: hypothetical protein VD997_11065 [Phycisphaerales bacterium]|nr:hypothetical protein [Phycisphaerales bacterium]
MKKSSAFLLAAVAATLATQAGAAITSYDLFASNYHWQYGTTPTPAYAFTFYTRIVSSNPADFTNASAVHTTGITPPMAMTDRGSEFSYTSPTYTTAAARNAAFPTGTYAFQVSGGTMGALNAFRQYSSNNQFPLLPPAFTNIAGLRNVDIRNDLDIPLSNFSMPTGVTGHTFIAVFDGDEIVAEGDSTPNAGAFTLPGNLLLPNKQYTISVYYTCRARTEAAGFSGASSDTGWDAITSTSLTTAHVCSSSDFNGDGDAGTDQDIEAFFACIGGNCCPTCWVGGADFNSDGDAATDQDIEAFFRVLGGGNC